MVCSFDREKYGSSAEPGLQEPATVAKRTRPAPIALASVIGLPGRSQYIQMLTSRAIGIVAAMVKVPQEEPGSRVATQFSAIDEDGIIPDRRLVLRTPPELPRVRTTAGRRWPSSADIWQVETFRTMSPLGPSV